MRRIKAYEDFMSKANESSRQGEKLLLELSSANSGGASKADWTIGFPRAIDITDECRYIGSLSNEEYTKIISAAYHQQAALIEDLLSGMAVRRFGKKTLRNNIVRKVNSRNADIQMHRDVDCKDFKGYDKDIKILIFDALISNGYVEANSDIWKIVDREDYEKEIGLLNGLFSLAAYINKGKTEEEVRGSNAAARDIIQDINTISYLIEEEGYSFRYRKMLRFDSAMSFQEPVFDGKYYISGVSVEIEGSSEDFIFRLADILRDHLDYVPSESISVESIIEHKRYRILVLLDA